MRRQVMQSSSLCSPFQRHRLPPRPRLHHSDQAWICWAGVEALEAGLLELTAGC